MNAILNEQSGEADALRDTSRTLPMQFNSYINSISNDNIHDDKKLLLLCFFINEEVWKLTEKEFQIDLQALLIF